MKPAIVVLLLFFSISSLPAKSFEAGKKGGHEADMYAILPFCRQESISQLLLVIHETIDKPVGYFPGLRDEPHKRFSWRKYGHRVFFHWGFNENPRNAPLLGQLVSECRWSKSVEESFWKKVTAEQARRNRLVMSSVGDVLSWSTSGFERDYVNAYASIIYDTHLLGDYTTSMIAPLQPIEPIITGLQKALFEKLKGGEQAKKFNKQLEAIKQSKVSSVAKAEQTLLLMKKSLPKLLLGIQNGYFKKHFEANSLMLKK